jgi:glucose-1-phosphate adenylyltransferase
MNTNAEMQIEEFEEKPKVPKNNQASMGIYIFKTDKLIKYLEEDNAVEESAHDFGKNIIPNMLNNKEKMMAFPFKGYWKDVGTIESLWLANMDLLGENPAFDIFNPYWKIHSRNSGTLPQFIGDNAVIQNSLISGGTKVLGTVINSVIGSNVVIEEGAIVKDSVIFNDVGIKEGAEVNYVILDEFVEIGECAKVGEKDAGSAQVTVVGRETVISANEVIEKGKNIEREAK